MARKGRDKVTPKLSRVGQNPWMRLDNVLQYQLCPLVVTKITDSSFSRFFVRFVPFFRSLMLTPMLNTHTSTTIYSQVLIYKYSWVDWYVMERTKMPKLWNDSKGRIVTQGLNDSCVLSLTLSSHIFPGLPRILVFSPIPLCLATTPRFWRCCCVWTLERQPRLGLLYYLHDWMHRICHVDGMQYLLICLYRYVNEIGQIRQRHQFHFRLF